MRPHLRLVDKLPLLTQEIPEAGHDAEDQAGITIPAAFRTDANTSALNSSLFGDIGVDGYSVMLNQVREEITGKLPHFSARTSLRFYDLMLANLAHTGDAATKLLLDALQDSGLDNDSFAKAYPDIVSFAAFIADSIEQLEKGRKDAAKALEFDAVRQDIESRLNIARDNGTGLRVLEEELNMITEEITAEAKRRFNDAPAHERDGFTEKNSFLFVHINFLHRAQQEVAKIKEHEKYKWGFERLSREMAELEGLELNRYLNTVMKPEIAATDALIAARFKAMPKGTTADDFKIAEANLLAYATDLEILYATKQKKFVVLTDEVTQDTTPPAPIYSAQLDMFGSAPANAPTVLPDWSYHPSKHLTQLRGTMPRLVKEKLILESFLEAERAKAKTAGRKVFENAYPEEHQRLAKATKSIQDILETGETEYRKHYQNIMINDLRADNNHLMPHFIAHLQAELEVPQAERKRLIEELRKKRHNLECKDEVARMTLAHAQARSRVKYMEDLLLNANHSYEIRSRPDYDILMECEPAINPKKLRAARSNAMNKLGTYDENVFDEDYLLDEERVTKISALTHLNDFIEPIVIPVAAGTRILGNIAAVCKARLGQLIREKVSPKIESAKEAVADGCKAVKKEFFKSLLQPKKFAGYAAAAVGAVGVVAIGASALISNDNSTDTSANADSKNVYVSIAESWNKVKGDIVSPAAKKASATVAANDVGTGISLHTETRGNITKIMSDVAKLEALVNDNTKATGSVVDIPDVPAPAPKIAKVSNIKTSVAKVNFGQVSSSPQDYAKPAVTIAKITVDGVTTNIDAETHKGACNFLTQQGLSSWLCQQPS